MVWQYQALGKKETTLTWTRKDWPAELPKPDCDVCYRQSCRIWYYETVL